MRPPTCCHAPELPQLHMQSMEIVEQVKGATAGDTRPKRIEATSAASGTIAAVTVGTSVLFGCACASHRP